MNAFFLKQIQTCTFSASQCFSLLTFFPNKPLFLRVCVTSLSKTLWEKEKLLITSNNVSFSHSVFHPFGNLSAIFVKFKIVICKLFQFGRDVWERVFKEYLSYLQCLTHYHTLSRVLKTIIENIVRNGENACNCFSQCLL